MSQKRNWLREETRKKHADIIISLGEKFYYAAFMTPLVIILKYGFSAKAIWISFGIFIFFSFLGLFFQKDGLQKYDKLDEK